MAEILSQNQIDELLCELSGEKKAYTESQEQKHIKEYDFKSPKKLARDQNKALAGIADVLGRHFAAYFAGLLRSYCEVTTASIEEHPYYEYNNSLADTLMSAVAEIPALKGSFIIDMSNPLTFAFIERMLGGNIEASVAPDREFTEIEISLMERVYRRICYFIQEAFANIPGIEVHFNQIETNPRFIKAIRIEEVVEVIVFNVVIGEIKGAITACIPYAYVEALLEMLSKTNQSDKTPESSSEDKNQMLGELSGSTVDICGILGSVRLSLGEVIHMQVGDVLKLNQKVKNPILVTVNGNKWFSGKAGQKQILQGY